jgi:hypothetical protein
MYFCYVLLIYDRCLRCDFRYYAYVFRCIVVRCCTLIYQVHIMGYVPYVGFATHCCGTVRIHLYFKILMIKQMNYIKKKKRVVTIIVCRNIVKLLNSIQIYGV